MNRYWNLKTGFPTLTQIISSIINTPDAMIMDTTELINKKTNIAVNLDQNSLEKEREKNNFKFVLRFLRKEDQITYHILKWDFKFYLSYSEKVNIDIVTKGNLIAKRKQQRKLSRYLRTNIVFILSERVTAIKKKWCL